MASKPSSKIAQTTTADGNTDITSLVRSDRKRGVTVVTKHIGTGSRTTVDLFGFGSAHSCIELDGHEARTLHRVLSKHYGTDIDLMMAKNDVKYLRDRNTELGNSYGATVESLSGERAAHNATKRELADLAIAGIMFTELGLPIMLAVERGNGYADGFKAGEAKGTADTRVVAERDCRKSFRDGLSKGFAAAQQLELNLGR